MRRLRELLLVPKCEINPDPLATSPCSGHVVIKTQENMGLNSKADSAVKATLVISPNSALAAGSGVW